MANHEKVTEAGARKVGNAYETNVLNPVQHGGVVNSPIRRLVITGRIADRRGADLPGIR